MTSSSAEAPDFVSYAEFGEQFFRRAVTAERVLGAVNLLAGQPIAFGPIGVGPGRLAKVAARGDIGAAAIDEVAGDQVAFRVVLPVSLSFEIDLGIEVHRFTAMLTVPLVLTARALDRLKVFLDITPPEPQEIGIELRAGGLRASVLQRVAGVEGEVRRFVAGYIVREIEKPYVTSARTIDVLAAIEMAWERIGPHRPSATAEHITDDLRGAVEHEHWESEVSDA